MGRINTPATGRCLSEQERRFLDVGFRFVETVFRELCLDTMIVTDESFAFHQVGIGYWFTTNLAGEFGTTFNAHD